MLPLISLATTLVPGLVGALGGSAAGAVTEKILSAAKAVFGTTDMSQIEAQVAADTSKLEMFRARVSAETEQFRLQVQDVQDARRRELELAQIRGNARNVRANLMLIGAFVILTVDIAVIALYRNSLPGEVLAILNIVAGGVISQIGQAFNFEFGSSRGSEQKSDQIMALTK